MQRYLQDDQQSALAGACPYLRLFGLTLGGACLANAGLAAEALAADGDASEPAGSASRASMPRNCSPPRRASRAIASGAAPQLAYETILADVA